VVGGAVNALSPPSALAGHVRRLWPGAGVFLPFIFVIWALACFAGATGRVEHAVILVVAPVLAYATPATKRLFLGLLPMGLLGIVYDTMRWVRDIGVTPQTVHVCDLRAIDMQIASTTMNGQRVTVHDWLQAHHSTVLDVICAIPYGTFIYVAVAFAIFLYVKDFPRMRLFGWSFLLLNLVGFVTYHLYPAAPPWYFHAHGCAVNLATPSSEGPNLARVDAMLGFRYFHAFYGRSSDVFGAVPSLHVGYPFLIVLFGWPVMGALGRTFAALFLVTMCTAAVYLDHHWIIDVIVGLLYTVIVFAAVTSVARARSSTTAPRRDLACSECEDGGPEPSPSDALP
jgi:hypothetical protein